MKLSSTSLAWWRQCPLRLWRHVHGVPHEAQQNSQQAGTEGTASAPAAVLARFNHQDVERVVREAFPQRVVIEEANPAAACEATRVALQQSPCVALFRGAWGVEDVLVRVDGLIPVMEDGQWTGYRLLHIRGSVQTKPSHHEEALFQAWVLRQAGIPVVGVDMVRVDRQFVFDGADYRRLLRYEPLALTPGVSLVAEGVAAMRQMLMSPEPPLGSGRCLTPGLCPFLGMCAHAKDKNVPTVSEEGTYPLSLFHHFPHGRRVRLEQQGVVDIRDVPEQGLSPINQRIARVTRAGGSECDPEAALMLARLGYPRFFFDFETVNFAVPPWEGLSPFLTHVPFQWSCHVQPSGESSQALLHHMFLDVTGNDPRRACAEKMLEVLGEEGPILVYDQRVERARILELSEQFPDLAGALQTLLPRVVDLLPITRAHYYHYLMRGSWSLKAVLPTVAPDLGYDHLVVADGLAAQLAYREIIHHGTTPERRQHLIQGLLTYSRLDTLALVRLTEVLEGRGYCTPLNTP